MTEKTLLNVEGMTCSNCAAGVSRYLEKKGLRDVQVDFTSGEVTFEEVKAEFLPEVISGINNLGYRVAAAAGRGSERQKEQFTGTLEFKFLICALLTVPLLLHMFIDWHLLHNPAFQLTLCLPVFLMGLSYFGKSAWGSLKTGIPNMDVLITIGSASAFFYSVTGMIMHYGESAVSEFMFFETTATIITLVMLGNIIEKRSVKRTTHALKELAAMQPVVAGKIIIGKDQSETIEKVSVSEIRKNDPVLVNTGDPVPVDGKVYWGHANIDEAALTGESLPVSKTVGDLVMAGSVVQAGSIKVVTEKSGNQTALYGIVELVKQAQQSKPEIQKLGDKVSAWFVPAVLLVSLLTFLFSFYTFDKTLAVSIMSAVAVLVVSCPCAMGLATPTAVAVGLGKAARNGILIKGGATLELFTGIKTAVFDKTGTLTTGNFKIKSIETTDISEEDAANIICSLEQHSSHPLAVSLVNELGKKRTRWIAFENVEEEKGLGIHATDNKGNKYILGSFQSHKHITANHNHSVYLSVNNKLIATIDLRDEMKPGAIELIRELKNNHIEPVILSGDQKNRCMEIAGQLGIEKVYYGKMPDEKSQIILQLKKDGRLLMVGDGINDAPSLAFADIGISFGEATKVAINSAQVIILNNTDLSGVSRALRIGSLTLTTIKQNLFWAFAYNIVAIPVAAMGYLSPMVAAFSMAFSDIVVIGNSIRLKFRK